MIKFILILQVCSSLYKPCIPSFQDSTLYDTWQNCGIAGYEQGMSIMKELESEEVNSSKIYVRFTCEEVIFPNI